MKILHLCFSNSGGGASIGASRLHHAMLNYGLDSRLLVVNKNGSDPTIDTLPESKIRNFAIKYFNRRLRHTYTTRNSVNRSMNLLPNGAEKYINSLEADIVQMHWIGDDTISIRGITRINKPVVWKLPDMWAISGAEHYTLPEDPKRYAEGYLTSNRPPHERGLDLNRLIWLYKKWSWKNSDFTIVTPSKWLKQCAEESILLKNRKIVNIPNPVDTNKYHPLPQEKARSLFGLPLQKKLIMFGAMGATSDRRKGFSYLKSSLSYLKTKYSPEQVELVVLGSEDNNTAYLESYRVHYLGTIQDEELLIKAYNTADVFVLPSEMDNLPNVIKEATCCGIPCVGFNIGGMPDMIDHQQNGYLANPYSSYELAEGIAWVLDNNTQALKNKVRKKAEKLHDPDKIVDKYINLYKSLL